MSIKKVLCATINHDHPQKGMLHAMRGIFGDLNVRDHDYCQLKRNGYTNQTFLAACLDHKPDWIWLQLQDTNIISDKEILEVRKHLPKTVITHWTGDARQEISSYLSSICRATHLTLISSVGMIPMFLKAGASQVEYLQIGLDWHEDVMGEPDWTPPFRVPEVVLIAGHYGDAFPGTRQREEAVRALQEAGIDVGIVGNWGGPWPVVGSCHVKQQHHVWKRAKVCLNVNNFNEIEQYYSDRQLISMASGTPVVCHYIPGLEREFALGHHCYSYETRYQLVRFVQELLNDELARKRMGQAGRSEVIKNHTWFSRFLSVLPMVEKIRQNLPG
ncbi:MAG: glycosyltransferase [Syntrophorhabdaceae bacterium]|nr:glycosyltransferase [Syntrophorhabdaceae bacterium]